MSKTPERMSLPAQAKKLIAQHEHAIDLSEEEALKRHSSAAAVLSAVCQLLNQRARYFGAAGEHFSVHDYEGIQMVDTLDERLLRAVRSVLKNYASRTRRKPTPKAVGHLAVKLPEGAPEMPRYPVGYMIHYLMLNTFKAFEPLAEDRRGFELPDLEAAMVHHLLGILDRYIQSREKPVIRHFSDVAREYSVVMRLKCGCGAERYGVRVQALCQSHGRDPYDRLELECRGCGSLRTITFDLPNFKDMHEI